jgi:hypothetical protein
MGKLICDLPDHPGEVKVADGCFEKVQRAVNEHLGVPVGRIYGVLGKVSPTWHITPDGADWHISPG